MKVYWIEPGDWECATTECLPHGSEGIAVVEASIIPILVEALEAVVWCEEDEGAFGATVDRATMKKVKAAIRKAKAKA